jgi:acetyltransferase-like isoleucine patch superfamily enzyme
MDKYFSKLYAGLSEEQLEDYHRAVFMNKEGDFAAAKRVEYYQGKLRYMGKNVKIGCGVIMLNPQYISLGDGIKIEDHCVLRTGSEKGITIDDGMTLKHGVFLDAEGVEGYIAIGKRVYVGTGCCLHGHKGLEIGDETLLAQNITITPYSHKFEDPLKTIIFQGGFTRKVSIGRDCYLGMNVSVLWSGDIGDGSVIGSGSVVVKPIPPYSVAVGVPAKVIRKRDGLQAEEKN